MEGGVCVCGGGAHMRSHNHLPRTKRTHSTPLVCLGFFFFLRAVAKSDSTPVAGGCLLPPPKSLSVPKLLVKRTKLENKTELLTNKITCCLHLVVAIKAPMTSEDGLLMWCLTAYQRFHNKCLCGSALPAPLPVILWPFVLPVVCCHRRFGICYIEIFIIKAAASDTAVKPTLMVKI